MSCSHWASLSVLNWSEAGVAGWIVTDKYEICGIRQRWNVVPNCRHLLWNLPSLNKPRALPKAPVEPFFTLNAFDLYPKITASIRHNVHSRYHNARHDKPAVRQQHNPESFFRAVGVVYFGREVTSELCAFIVHAISKKRWRSWWEDGPYLQISDSRVNQALSGILWPNSDWDNWCNWR